MVRGPFFAAIDLTTKRLIGRVNLFSESFSNANGMHCIRLLSSIKEPQGGDFLPDEWVTTTGYASCQTRNLAPPSVVMLTIVVRRLKFRAAFLCPLWVKSRPQAQNRLAGSAQYPRRKLYIEISII